jgi:hypothetical protein
MVSCCYRFSSLPGLSLPITPPLFWDLCSGDTPSTFWYRTRLVIGESLALPEPCTHSRPFISPSYGITLQWIPLFVLLVLHALETRRLKIAACAGLCLALVALTSWYCGLFCMIFTLLLALVRVPSLFRSRGWLGEGAIFGVVALVAGLILLPVLFPVLIANPPNNDEWDPGMLANSADLLDFLLPSQFHPLVGNAVVMWNQQIRPDIGGWNITPGYGVLLLAAIGGWQNRRKAGRWAALAAGLSVLALGPSLHVAGVDTGVPLPYALLRYIPGATIARRPNHFMVLAQLCLVLLASFGTLWLLSQGRRGKMILIVLLGLTAAEYIVVPPPVLAFDVHPGYRLIQHEPGAVADLPVETEASTTLRNQIVHGRPILGGFLARTPDELIHTALIPGQTELWYLRSADQQSDILEPPPPAHEALSYYGIRTIVVRRDALEPERLVQVQQVIERLVPNAIRHYADPALAIYEIPHATARDPFVYLWTGWQPVEYDQQRIWRWIGERAELRAVNPDTVTRQITLEISAGSNEVPRHVFLRLDGQLLGTVEVLPVQTQIRTYRFLINLLPGEHTVSLSSSPIPGTQVQPNTSKLSFVRIKVTAQP